MVEERIKNLRKLLDDTDKRISVYTRELQRSRNSEAIYKNLGRGIREALDSIPMASEKPLSPVEPVSSAALEATPPTETTTPSEIPAPVKTASTSQKTLPAEINELPFNDEEKGPQVSSVKRQKKHKTANLPPQKKPPEKSGIKMQIAQMALQGLSPSQIASRLGISLAEVDLALQLLNINR